jgi:hypothetical protein
MPEFDQEQLRKWAVSGAEQRLLEIATEAAAIYKAFPELRERGREGPAAEDRGSGAAGRARRTSRKMSTANRKAVSDRMKKYWAARRGGSAGAATRTTKTSTRTATRGAARVPRKLSPAARKRISDAQKKRWAAYRKEGGV